MTPRVWLLFCAVVVAPLTGYAVAHGLGLIMGLRSTPVPTAIAAAWATLYLLQSYPGRRP